MFYVFLLSNGSKSQEILCFPLFVTWSSWSKYFRCTPMQQPSHWVRLLFHPPRVQGSEQTMQSFSFFPGRRTAVCTRFACLSGIRIASGWSTGVAHNSSTKVHINLKCVSFHWAEVFCLYNVYEQNAILSMKKKKTLFSKIYEMVALHQHKPPFDLRGPLLPCSERKGRLVLELFSWPLLQVWLIIWAQLPVIKIRRVLLWLLFFPW